MKASIHLVWAAALLLCASSQSFASVVINGTRIIYPASEREVTIKLDNNGDSPSLVQAWLDGGDPKQAPEKSTAPFLLTPPLTRIENGRGQTLRLIYTGAPQPQDRESVFWLNVLEIPPQATDAAARNYLQIAFRSRVKVFFRPKGLPGLAIDAPEKLRWSVVPDPTGLALQVDNPTVYHVSFSQAGITANGKDYTYKEGGMVAPFSKTLFHLKDLTQQPATASPVHYTFINDYGSGVDSKAVLQTP